MEQETFVSVCSYLELLRGVQENENLSCMCLSLFLTLLELSSGN